MVAREESALTYALVVVLVVLVFVADILTPFGLELWVAYLIPLLLLARLAQPRTIAYYLAACSLLISIDVFVSGRRVNIDFALLNRFLALSGLWLVGLLVVQRNRAAAALQRATEEALQRSQIRFRRLVDSNLIGFMETDLDGHVSDANDAFLNTIGYTFDDLRAGQINWRTLTPPEYQELDAQVMRQVQATGEPAAYEKELFRKDGGRVPVLIGAAVVGADDCGAGACEWVCFALDLTARKEAEAELRRARAELEVRVKERTAELSCRGEELAQANAALQASQQELQVLSRRLVEALEDERRAIARELHDEAGQSLTALKLGLSQLGRQVNDPQAIMAGLDGLRQLADGVMEDLHRLAVNLRPPGLDRSGLVPALEQYIASLRDGAALEVDLAVVGLEDERLPGEVETTVYRVVQEALTNVARHAQASHAAVIVARRGTDCVAIVEDDGVGFDVEAALRSGRLGLVGMRERAILLGGDLEIESAPGHGTTVHVELPLGP